ncbi:hypothetical protein Q8G01_27105, partial [Klebsiella pneumoniae]|uniref:hypothetical protein n=1 Tax=Klebsiella pneumoniae TaxID=573 RepID=UPI0027306E1C
ARRSRCEEETVAAVVEAPQPPPRRTKAVGKIVEVLGAIMGTGMAVDMALRTHEVPYVWPPAVEKQVSGLKEQVLSLIHI